MKAVGIGADLRRDPARQPHQGRRQGLSEPEHPLEAREGDLYTLPLAALVGPLGHQGDPAFGQGVPQRFASVGQVPQEPSREIFCEVRLVDEFLRQAHFCHVGGGELVGDGHPVRRAQEVQLHPVDAERTPPHPPRSRETRGLSDLARMQRGQQGGVDQKGFRIAYQLADDLPAQGLQKAPGFLTLRCKEEG